MRFALADPFAPHQSIFNKNTTKNGGVFIKSGRGERIRTFDTLVPNQVLYQTELRPETRTIIYLFFQKANRFCKCCFFYNLIDFALFLCELVASIDIGANMDTGKKYNTGYDYKNYTFKYPKLTLNAATSSDICKFYNCNLRAVTDMKLSGFKEVSFAGYTAVLNPLAKIEISNCNIVKFENTDFMHSRVQLIIKNAHIIFFECVDYTDNLDLQIQNSGTIRYDNSVLRFDTSKIQAKEFHFSGAQLDFPTMNLTGVSKLTVNGTNIFNVQDVILKRGTDVFISCCYGGEEKLKQAIRYQGR